MKNGLLCVPEKCTGCGACVSACPIGVVGMKPDEEGFLHPYINENSCVDCGKCIRVCPVQNSQPESRKEHMPLCYAAWSKDEEVRRNSTSGGVFSQLAYQGIRRGGVVAGARYREDSLVEHGIADTMEGVNAFRQSKYVQSDMQGIYKQVEKELASGRLVLFSGTPCQCAGMRSYLGREYENLLLCDFICLGVNSPLVYLTYLKELENDYQSRAEQIWFKNKTFGWNRFSTKIIFENGNEYIADRDTDLYMQGYIKANQSLYMRQSCYDCQFRGIVRPVDFTLGDFWGIERYMENVESQSGVSAVLIHSLKGERFFEQCKEGLYYDRREASEVLPCNPRLVENIKKSEKRESFFRAMEEVGFAGAMQKILEEEGGN